MDEGRTRFRDPRSAPRNQQVSDAWIVTACCCRYRLRDGVGATQSRKHSDKILGYRNSELGIHIMYDVSISTGSSGPQLSIPPKSSQTLHPVESREASVNILLVTTRVLGESELA